MKKLNANLERSGTGINVTKSEYLSNDVSESGTINLEGTELPRTNAFEYLGSMVSSDAGFLSQGVTALAA
ncbi:hypothetical protein Y032_0166g59 [Ancylostoma ceylanicum]|uniref:Reverse transcriptase domain-containing protein n=1 Tax=Ancylostoma ceylanicum TaxID=53326 RepID=A0A016SWI4_9BILA|nr:hypothetical protein Y032_0166g59 [Ancylostoma ceylanicum]